MCGLKEALPLGYFLNMETIKGVSVVWYVSKHGIPIKSDIYLKESS